MPEPLQPGWGEDYVSVMCICSVDDFAPVTSRVGIDVIAELVEEIAREVVAWNEFQYFQCNGQIRRTRVRRKSTKLAYHKASIYAMVV